MKKVLIGGIGNVLLGDDGVGPYMARLLEARYEFDEGVEVADLGTPALDLIDQLSGKDGVILIDSISIDVETNGTDVVPGTVVLYRKADIMRLRPSVRMDPHSPALVDALLSAELFGVAPRDLLLVGIQAESFEPSCSLSLGRRVPAAGTSRRTRPLVGGRTNAGIFCGPVEMRRRSAKNC